MRFALVNPNWSFDGSTYFGCHEPQQFAHMSDIQDQQPVPLAELELSTAQHG